MTQRAIDGEYIYFVTANVQDRRWYFVTDERAGKLGQAIQTCCRMKAFDLLQYCILPNHMHLLVRKIPETEVVGQKQAQRRLGSLRCGTGGELGKNADTDAGQLLLGEQESFLFHTAGSPAGGR